MNSNTARAENPQPDSIRSIERAKELAREIAAYEDGMFAESLIELLSIINNPQGSYLTNRDAADFAMDEAYLHTEAYYLAKQRYLRKYESPEGVN